MPRILSSPLSALLGAGPLLSYPCCCFCTAPSFHCTAARNPCLPIVPATAPEYLPIHLLYHPGTVLLIVFSESCWGSAASGFVEQSLPSLHSRVGPAAITVRSLRSQHSAPCRPGGVTAPALPAGSQQRPRWPCPELHPAGTALQPSEGLGPGFCVLFGVSAVLLFVCLLYYTH